jgi:hypothetical protein
VLGYATVGLAIIADVAIATAATSRIGTHAAVLGRPWGSSALRVGSPLLMDVDASRCVARTLGRAARSNDDVAVQEARFIAAHLDRPIYDGSVWTRIGADERRTLTEELGLATDDGCIDAVLAEFPAVERRTLVGWMATVLAIDGRIDPQERRWLDIFVGRVQGDGIIGDGLGLRDDDITAIIAHVESLLTEDGMTANALAEDNIETPMLSDLVWGLDEAIPSTVDAVHCALQNDCR